MRARSPLTLLAAGAALFAPAAAADAAKYPTVSEIAPMKVAIGETMTITGRNYLSGANKTTVVFKKDGKQAIFVRVPVATKRKLTFTVPDKLAPFVAAGPDGSKFRVRILTGRFGKRYTKLGASPRIVARTTAPSGGSGPATTPPATVKVGGPTATPRPLTPPPPDCDKDGKADNVDTDDDNDRLTDAQEKAIKTDACLADTDNDGEWDSWEYRSALDLNDDDQLGVMPYPGKRPYPNPLYPDQNVDFDGDGLLGWQEHLLWQRFDAAKDLTKLLYSDGKQMSVAATGQTDDNRDQDADGLTNFTEANGSMQRAWWVEMYKDEIAYPVVYHDSDFIDPDTDGDGRLDGADDTDHDGYSNVQEHIRGAMLADLTDPTVFRAAWTNPFNPCLPNPGSRTCSLHVPILVNERWAPFKQLGYPIPLPSAGGPARPLADPATGP